MPSTPDNEKPTFYGTPDPDPTLLGPPDSPTPVTIPSKAAAMGPVSFAGYEILGEIAQGGMGVVYKARRVDLDRTVALKVMIAGEHATVEMLERFHLEAKAAARLEHPNIVRIFEVGAEGSRHFFTMQFVEGKTVSSLVRHGEVPPRRAMEITRKVALALAYAHAQGILHRDVKPSNIIVDPAGEPHLADFGLAKDLSSGGITAPGATLGTPAYASPEQLEGDNEQVGPRSDVYSLGATLYEMLTGHSPFGGDSALEIIAKVLYEELDPPRKLNPKLQADLETICLKAMEKDPDRRYEGAAEMAADIGRYLDGEPISARPTSWIGRHVHRAKRSRRALAAGAIAVLVVLLCGIWIVAQSQMRREEVIRGLEEALRWRKGAGAAADRSGRKEALTRARLALLGVLKLEDGNGTATRMIAVLDGDLAAIDAEEREERKRAALEAAAAEEALRKADLVSKVLSRWGRLLDTLGRLEANFYDSRVKKAERRARAAKLWPEFEAFMRETPDDETSQAAMKALAGWARVFTTGASEGVEMMRESAKQDPDVPLGPLMEALVSFCSYLEKQKLPSIAFGRTGIQVGAPAEETTEMKADRVRMETALARAREARVWGKEGASEVAAAMDGLRAVNEGRYAEAEQALSGALGAPELKGFESGLFFARATVRYLLRDFKGGREDIERVVSARPNQAKAWDYVGRMRYAEAIETAWRGVDPRGTLELAIEAHTRALGLDDGPAETWNNRSNALHELSDAQAERGIDPRPALAKAIADVEQVIRRLPNAAEAWTNRANLRLAVGRAGAARGEDPRAELDRCVEDFGRAIALGPGYTPAYLGRGNAWKERGDAEGDHGGDPRAAYARAVEDYGKALEIRATFAEAYNNRGNARVALGKEELSRGGDARDHFRRGIEDYEEMLARIPGSPEALHNRAFARVLLSKAESVRGDDPRPTIEKAIEDYGKAIESNANDPGTYSSRGNAWLALGSANGEKGIDPRPWLEKGVADFEKALELNPEYGDAYNNRGNALSDIAEVEKRLGMDSQGTFERAIRDFDEALRRNPEDAAAYNNRGSARMKLGDALAAAGKDAAGAWEKSLADFDAVLAKNPRLWQGHANRGLLFDRLGRYEEAVREFDIAIERVGDNAPSLKEWRERARAKIPR